jgi:hypothetical protein
MVAKKSSPKKVSKVSKVSKVHKKVSSPKSASGLTDSQKKKLIMALAGVGAVGAGAAAHYAAYKHAHRNAGRAGDLSGKDIAPAYKDHVKSQGSYLSAKAKEIADRIKKMFAKKA